MTEYKSYTNALKQCAKEHENELVSFAHIRTTDLCNDTANLLEKLETESDNSITIPEGATNGDMIKAMFPNDLWLHIHARRGKKDWWNTPYKKGCNSICQQMQIFIRQRMRRMTSFTHSSQMSAKS